MRPVRAATRVLPWTICAMAALLAVKSIDLVRAAGPGEASVPSAVVPPARAEGAAKPAEPAPPTTAPSAGAPSKTAPSTTAPSAGLPAAQAAERSPLDKTIQMPPSPARAAAPDVMVSESERALLLDLRQRRTEIDAREAALTGREAVLSAAEKRLDSRLDELTGLQHRLEALEAARKDRDEANWKGLVKLYETMKPRDAATIFNDLDLPVLLQVVDRMREAKAAPILAAMQPDRARQVTAELAQMRARANTVATPAAATSQPAPPSNGPAASGKGKT